MSEFNPSSIVESAPAAEPNPAAMRPELEWRKAQRLAELSSSALGHSDPKRAVLGAAGAESLELLGLVMSAVRSAAVEVADPGEKLKLLKGAASSFSNLARIGEKLA